MSDHFSSGAMAMPWTVATNRRLLPDERNYLDRTHVYTSFPTSVEDLR